MPDIDPARVAQWVSDLAAVAEVLADQVSSDEEAAQVARLDALRTALEEGRLAPSPRREPGLGAVPRESGTGRLLRRFVAVYAVEYAHGAVGTATSHATGALPLYLGEVLSLQEQVAPKGGRALLTNIIELADPPAAPEGTSP